MEVFERYLYLFISPYINTSLLLGLVYLGFFRKRKQPIGIYFLLAIGITWLGISIGIFAGNSREPAVNTVITSTLTLVAGLLVYLFDKKSKKETVNFSSPNNNYYPILIFLLFLPISMLYGAVIGTHNRVKSELNELQLKVSIEQQQKYNDLLMRVDEDSIKVFLEIYKDSILQSYNHRPKRK